MPTETNPGKGTNDPTATAETDGAANDLNQLRGQLEKAEQQRDELLRSVAEYENARRRAARDLEVERRFAHKTMAYDLLPALDNLERALDAARQAGDAGPLMQGVQATQNQLLDVLKRHGVTRIEVRPGTAFDPNFMDAVMQQPAPQGQQANTVLQVLQQGYMIHDRVLRPASVIVAS